MAIKDPSIPGFIRYVANGRKLPSEVEAEKAKEKAAEADKKQPATIDSTARALKSRQSQIDSALEEAGVGKKKGGAVKKKYARGGGVELRGKSKGTMR